MRGFHDAGLNDFEMFSHTFLLELLDGTLVDTTALVDQVAGGGRLAGVDVADNDHVDVSLVLLTCSQSVSYRINQSTSEARRSVFRYGRCNMLARR